jgi:hypothetical protein
VIYAYAERDQIRVGSTGGFFGLTLESLFTSAGISDLLKRGGDGAARLGRAAGLPRGPERAGMSAPAAPRAPRAPGAPRPDERDASDGRRAAQDAQRAAEDAKRSAEQTKRELHELQPRKAK